MKGSEFGFIIDRRVPGDIKYKQVTDGKDVIPMWIADMDFMSPVCVREALMESVRRNIWNYTETDSSYDQAVIAWYEKRFLWSISPESILKMPGVMFAVAASIRALTEPGDSVLICQPVYYPFEKIIVGNDRRPIVSELILHKGKYQICFDDFEERIIKYNVKLFLLCSPHNPVGRVWSREELSKIAEICLRHNVWIVSDEIHSDFVYGENRHIPIATLSDEVSERCITCTSPTKTFNIAGLQAANIIISNASVRRKVYKAGLATGYGNLNAAAIAATKAAYLEGEPWLELLLTYLKDNISLVRAFCADGQNQIELIEPEGTYLLWLDFRKSAMDSYELEKRMLNKVGVRLHNGTVFGAGGDGFMRMNIATPKSLLQEALYRIKNRLPEK